MKTDILVIGSGGAGLRAAIEAADHGAEVIVVGKTLLGKAHTVMAEGGINAALGNIDVQDNWTIHFKDTVKEGHEPFLMQLGLLDRTPRGRTTTKKAHEHLGFEHKQSSLI